MSTYHGNTFQPKWTGSHHLGTQFIILSTQNTRASKKIDIFSKIKYIKYSQVYLKLSDWTPVSFLNSIESNSYIPSISSNLLTKSLCRIETLSVDAYSIYHFQVWKWKCTSIIHCSSIDLVWTFWGHSINDNWRSRKSEPLHCWMHGRCLKIEDFRRLPSVTILVFVFKDRNYSYEAMRHQKLSSSRLIFHN